MNVDSSFVTAILISCLHTSPAEIGIGRSALSSVKPFGKVIRLRGTGRTRIDDLNPAAINYFHADALAGKGYQRAPARMHADADSGALHESSPSSEGFYAKKAGLAMMNSPSRFTAFP